MTDDPFVRLLIRLSQVIEELAIAVLTLDQSVKESRFNNRTVLTTPTEPSTQTYLTVPELRTYLRFPSMSAVWSWLHRHPEVRKCRRGRSVLIRRSDADRAVAPLDERERRPRM